MLQWCCSDLQWQQVRITVELVAFVGCPCISGFHVFHLFDQITLLTPHRLQSRFLVLCLMLKNCLPKDQITSQTTQVFNKTVQILSQQCPHWDSIVSFKALRGRAERSKNPFGFIFRIDQNTRHQCKFVLPSVIHQSQGIIRPCISVMCLF